MSPIAYAAIQSDALRLIEVEVMPERPIGKQNELSVRGTSKDWQLLVILGACLIVDGICYYMGL